jgi:alpha-L-fucosidase
MLLNATPDTNGNIPAGDQSLYRALGEEIRKRFSDTPGSVANITGSVAELRFEKSTVVNHTVLMEDYRQGHRIRAYMVEGYADGRWREIASGSSVGRKKIDPFPDAAVTAIRLTVTASAATPLIRSFEAYYVKENRIGLQKPK